MKVSVLRTPNNPIWLRLLWQMRDPAPTQGRTRILVR